MVAAIGAEVDGLPQGGGAAGTDGLALLAEKLRGEVTHFVGARRGE
jgi:hypothetical protein